jgi:hypothetical protein
VTKFNGYYNQVVQMKKSGWNEADILERAKEMYLQFYGGGTHLKKKKPFSYMNCWEYLLDKEKWRVVRVDAKRKTPSASASAQQNIGTELQVIQLGQASASAHERPPGNKKSKAVLKLEQQKDRIEDDFKMATIKMVASHEKRTAAMEDAVKLQRRNANMQLFSLDLSKVPPESARYYEMLREEAMEEIVAARATAAVRAVPKVTPVVEEPVAVSEDFEGEV